MVRKFLPVKPFNKEKVIKEIKRHIAPEFFEVKTEDDFVVIKNNEYENILVYKSYENYYINSYDECGIYLIAFKNIKELKRLLLDYFRLDTDSLINEEVKIVDYGSVKVKFNNKFVAVKIDDYYASMKLYYDDNGNLEDVLCSNLALAKKIVKKFNLTRKPDIKKFIKKFNLKPAKEIGGLLFIEENEETIVKLAIFEEKYKNEIEASGYYYGDKFEYTIYYYVNDIFEVWKKLGIKNY